VDIKGEDLSRYSDKIQTVCLRKKPTNKANLIDITVASISQSFTHEMAPKTSWIDMELNYVTVIVCIAQYTRRSLGQSQTAYFAPGLQ